MRLSLVAAGLLVTFPLLAGCSSKAPANETLPTPSATSDPARATLPPLGPPDFPMPAEARAKTPAGAEAFLRYYLALVTHQAGKDGRPLRQLSQACDFCTFMADRYDQDAAAGYSYRGGSITIDFLSGPAMRGDVAEFALSLSQDPTELVTSSGDRVPGRGDGRRVGMNTGATMTWNEARASWLLRQLIVNN